MKDLKSRPARDGIQPPMAVRRPPAATPRPAGLFWVTMLLAAILTAGGVFYVWQRYMFVRLGFEVSALRQQQTRLREQLDPLEVEVDFLTRPEQIEAAARKKLNMRLPDPSQVHIVEIY
ncbi:MAG: cell division protein FtsL, partial [Deltaproteobacteria bacterium]|nr:cell division protein FtsL [Deltaproteobacteria bacterium]